jgi:hypothetical protein
LPPPSPTLLLTKQALMDEVQGGALPYSISLRQIAS